MSPDIPRTEFLLHEIVRAHARSAPDHVALIFKDRQYDWGSLQAAIEALARGLAAKGVVRGSRVAVLDRNSDHYILLYYALASLGAALCPINMWLRAKEVAYIIRNCRPSLLVTSDEFRALADEALNEVERKPRIVSRGAVRPGDLGWSDIADGPEAVLPEPLSWNDTHMILHTSGTTGRPKGVALSHRRTVVDGMCAAASVSPRRTDRFYSFTPLFHTGAWDWMKLFITQRASVVLADRFDALAAIEEMDRHRCTYTLVLPVVMREMLDHPAFDKADFSAMRMVAYASQDPSNLLDEVFRRFAERGAKGLRAVYPYGMTEAGPFVTVAQPHESADHPNSLGTLIAGVELALLDDDLNEVPIGEVGEVCVRGATLMTEYIDNPEATDEAFRGGWLHTGDLARQEKDGFFYVVDRKKDMIRSAGENVFAKEVEQVVVQHPSIRECAVIGLPDMDYGERVVACVVAVDGFADEADVIGFVRRRIAGFKTPRQVVFLAELPHTPVGKIAKAVLRDMLKPSKAA